MVRLCRARVTVTALVVFVVVIIVATVVVIGAASRAAAADTPRLDYRPPVDAPVRDPYRAPPGPYAAGNRGIEYDTTPGTTVTAAADGAVVFAGLVAGEQWVTLQHADGLRTTVGPLEEVAVVAGQQAKRGTVVGIAAGPLLFTVRRGESYIDPATVLSAGDRVRLVADGQPIRDGTRASSLALAARVLHQLIDAVPDTAARLTTRPFNAIAMTREMLRGAQSFWRQRGSCTRAGVHPRPPDASRLAVLVGGLGSSSDDAAIDRLDLGALGYAPDARLRFSYAGGRIPSRDRDRGRADTFEGVQVTTYDAADTLGDIDRAGDRLADLLVAIAALAGDGHKAAPIDIYAHSQGGLVARRALARLAETRPDVIDRLGLVVTFATPHEGAPLAGAVRSLVHDPLTRLMLEGVQEMVRTGIEPDAEAIDQLAPGSSTALQLGRSPLPTGPRYVSIAAWADVAVPPARARLSGATNVVVGVPGLDDHGGLPGAPAAQREVALALAGLPPSCSSPLTAIGGWALATLVNAAETAVGG